MRVVMLKSKAFKQITLGTVMADEKHCSRNIIYTYILILVNIHIFCCDCICLASFLVLAHPNVW